MALAGAAFARTWGDGRHQGADFFDAIAKQMPKNAPGSLSRADNLALAAFILEQQWLCSGCRAADRGGRWRVRCQRRARPRQRRRAGGTAGGATVFPQPPPPCWRRAAARRRMRSCCACADADWLTYNRTLAGDRYLAADPDQCRQRASAAGEMHRAAGRDGQLRNQPHRARRADVRHHRAQGAGTGCRDLRGQMVLQLCPGGSGASAGQPRRGAVRGPRIPRHDRRPPHCAGCGQRQAAVGCAGCRWRAGL